MWVMRHFPLQYLVSRFVWPDIYKQASYKNIASEEGEWVERELPWSI